MRNCARECSVPKSHCFKQHESASGKPPRADGSSESFEAAMRCQFHAPNYFAHNELTYADVLPAFAMMALMLLRSPSPGSLSVRLGSLITSRQASFAAFTSSRLRVRAAIAWGQIPLSRALASVVEWTLMALPSKELPSVAIFLRESSALFCALKAASLAFRADARASSAPFCSVFFLSAD